MGIAIPSRFSRCLVVSGDTYVTRYVTTVRMAFISKMRMGEINLVRTSFEYQPSFELI